MSHCTHAVYRSYANAYACVFPLPVDETEKANLLSMGYEYYDSYPSEQEAEKAKADFCFSLNPEYLGSIH